MSAAAGNTREPRQIVLPCALTVAGLAGLKQQIDEALASGVPLLIDLDEVERIDTAGMQCLLALAPRIGPVLRFRGDSEALRSLGALYNLGGPLAPLFASTEQDHA